MTDINISFVNRSKPKKHEIITEHSHTCTEIVIYIKGKGSSVIDGKNHEIKNNSIAVIHPNVIHSEIHNEECMNIYFGFGPETELIKHVPDGIYYPSVCDKFVRIANDMYDEVRTQKEYYPQVLSSLVWEFLFLLNRDLNDTNNPEHKNSLEFCANYMRENYSQKIDIEKMSKEFGYSYDNFRHLFKKQYKKAPHDYIIEQRLINAERMIRYSNQSCTDIAMLCGFSDSSQFSKMYKRKFGTSPKKYQLLCNTVKQI